MNRFYKIVAGAVLLLVMGACSSGDKISEESTPTEQAAPEKSAVKQFTDDTAEKIEQEIRTPIDKARATRGLNDEHSDALDQALQQSTGGQ